MHDDEKRRLSGNFIRHLRVAVGVSPAELSLKLGRVATYVEDVESAEIVIALDDFIELVEALGYDPGEALRALLAVRRQAE